MEKFELDRERGLVAQRTRAGGRGLTTTVVHGAVARAMRRGRISSDTARLCMGTWHIDLANRTGPQVWRHVASAALLEVAQLRRRGQYGLARVVLGNVRGALHSSRMAK